MFLGAGCASVIALPHTSDIDVVGRGVEPRGGRGKLGSQMARTGRERHANDGTAILGRYINPLLRETRNKQAGGIDIQGHASRIGVLAATSLDTGFIVTHVTSFDPALNAMSGFFGPAA